MKAALQGRAAAKKGIMTIGLIPEVQAFVEGLEPSTIPQERREILANLAAFLQTKVDKKEIIHLNFICTHNSRRSQLCQVWAQVAAYCFGVENLQTFSGGTEATAFHPNAVQAVACSGLDIAKEDKADNPVYIIQYALGADPLRCFSKVYDDPSNAVPFVAVMTCSDAETNCPFIPDAEARFPVKYEDPKKSDGTPLQEAVYAERSRQIATEMMYLFSQVKE